MRQVDALYTLVLSLTKSEKRYFRLYCQLQQGDRLYLNLYDYIQQANGNDEQVRTAFCATHSFSQFEAARKHLYAVLLRCLRNYRADTTIENRLIGQLEEAQILFSKGLSSLALHQLRAVQTTAQQHEKFIIYQWALELELTYLMQVEFGDLSEEAIIERHEQLNSLLRQQNFTHQHNAINHLLVFRYSHQGITRSPSDDKRLNDLLLEEHRINGLPHTRTFEAQKLHLHFQAAYFLMTGQYDESLKTYLELNCLFAQHPSLGQQTPLYHTYLIDGILTGLKSIRQYAAMETFLESLQPMADLPLNQSTGLTELLVSHRMSMLLDKQQFGSTLFLFQQHTSAEKLAIWTNGLTHGRALLLFYGACAHFGLGSFSASLKLINQLLSVPQATLSRTLYSAVRLFELLIHVELGGEDYLPYKIRSVEYKLRSQKRLFKAERLVLAILRQAHQYSWQHTSVADTISLLVKLRDSPYSSRLNQLFDFTAWIVARSGSSQKEQCTEQ